jgi:DNA-binding transcriptional LysR family regulator
MSSFIEMSAFVRIAEAGSFAAAADGLGLTASALSKLFTRLETRLGVTLITRTTRRHTLTAEGELYLAHARAILAAVEAAEQDVTASQTRPSGHIRINAGTAIGRHQLTPLLPTFLARFPGITVDVGISDRQVDPVAENLDVVLRTGPLADSTLVVRKLAESRRIICASPAYLERHGVPALPSDLMHHNCLLVLGSQMSRLARWPFHTPEGVNRLEVGGDVTADSADVLIDLAIAGHGIIRMLERVVAQPLREGLLVPLLADAHVEEPIPVWAITPPGRNRLRRVRALLDFLAGAFSAAPGKVGGP